MALKPSAILELSGHFGKLHDENSQVRQVIRICVLVPDYLENFVPQEPDIGMKAQYLQNAG